MAKDERRVGTDWERLGRQTDRQIQNAVAADADAAPVVSADWLRQAVLQEPQPKEAVRRPAQPVHRRISECIELMPADSTATIDPEFAKDVESAIAAHREPLEPPSWD